MDCLFVLLLGPDVILLDTAILTSFQAVLDWDGQTLLFESLPQILSESHRPDLSSTPTFFCIALVDDATPVLVHVHSSVFVPARSEMLVEVGSLTPPLHTSLALNGPGIIKHDCFGYNGSPLPSGTMWESLPVAQSVATWLHDDRSAIVRLANTAEHGINMPAPTIVFICPVKHVTPLTTSSVVRDEPSLTYARTCQILIKASEHMPFTNAEQSELLDLCACYRAASSLNSNELSR